MYEKKGRIVLRGDIFFTRGGFPRYGARVSGIGYSEPYAGNQHPVRHV
jgi:hypothetical protein